MLDLTLIILGSKQGKNKNQNVEMIYCNGDNIIDNIDNASGKYIAFIKEEDKISKEYLTSLIEMSKIKTWK